MEIARGDDNLGIGDALHAIGPAARRFDRGFHRLRAGVHRQRDVESRQCAELLEKRREPVIVKGAGRHREPLRLLSELCKDSGMRVTEADS